MEETHKTGRYIDQQFGNYRFIRLLGQGGFAEVYLGEHIFLKTYAAIKVLHTQLASADRESFLIEAQTLAQLKHPHIISVLDFGLKDTTIPFLVTDYAPNGTLRQAYPRGTRVPLANVIAYVNDVADALQYAHDKGWVHRDVKPENMLLGCDNKILLSDFGIAVTSHSRIQPIESKQEAVGTISYMAPEQMQGKSRTASDQYSLAVVVYEWLCGEPPFQGTFVAVASQHMHAEPPPLREKNPAISSYVEEVVMIALSKNPERRFKTVKVFARALENVARESTAPAPVSSILPVTDRIPVPSNLAYATVLAPETSAINSVLPQTDKKFRPERRFFLLALAGVTGVAAVATGAIYLINTLQDHARPLLSFSHRLAVRSVVWSPDGSSICSAGADDSVVLWNMQSNNQLTRYEDFSVAVNSVAWSPNAQYIAAGTAHGDVRILNKDDITKSFYLPGAEHVATSAVSWSSDSANIAVGYSNGLVKVYNVAKQKLIYQFSHATRVTSVAWSPKKNDSRIVTADANGAALVWSIENDTVVMPQLGQDTGIFAASWSPDARSIATSSSSIQVWSSTPTNQNQPAYTTAARQTILTVAWSPKDTYLASGGADNTLYIWKALTGELVMSFTGHTRPINMVAWSPDGRRVVSASDDYTLRIWQVF